MVIETLIQYAGGLAGFVSILWNLINSRREQVLSLYPKINVDVQTSHSNGVIFCSADVENVGNRSVYIRSVQFFSLDEGFEEDLLFGPAIYSSDILVHNGEICNRVHEICQPLSRDNLIQAICDVFSIDASKISLPESKYDELVKMIAEGTDRTLQNFEHAVLVRGAFLVPSFFKALLERDGIPATAFPDAFEPVLFNRDLYYHTDFRKSYNALNDDAYRLIWKEAPVFSLKPSSPLMTLNPKELGLPSELAQYENRRFELRIPIAGKDSYRVQVKLYLTQYKLKKLIFQKETLSTYVYYSPVARHLLTD